MASLASYFIAGLAAVLVTDYLSPSLPPARGRMTSSAPNRRHRYRRNPSIDPTKATGSIVPRKGS
jgi:hypothetical protein